MAYTSTVDEYRGDAFNYRGAGYRDAPSVLGYTLFHLAQADVAFGALSTATDVDLYRLGWLLPGTYTFQVEASAWQSTSAISASAAPALELLNAQGGMLPQSSSSVGTLALEIRQAGDYQIRLSSSDGKATQYQLSYTFSSAVANVKASGQASVVGDLSEGHSLTANYSFSDANGTQTVTPDVQWFAYTAATGWLPVAGANRVSYDLTAQDVGKYLAYNVSFVDNQGYREILNSAVSTSAVVAASVHADTLAPVAPRWSASSHWHYAINPRVTLTTSLGVIELELEPNSAPQTVDNWLAYVNSGFLDGLIFHRVIDHFMIQGGGFDQNWVQKASSYAPVPLESSNGLSNVRGSLAMARTSVANSATSQFYINLQDNAFLDYQNPQASDPLGYAVFGHVLSGLEVVDQIAKVSTGKVAGMSNVPMVETLIQSAVQSLPGFAYGSNGVMTIDGLESGGSWAYSLDAGHSWLTGQGNTLVLPGGHYAAGDVRIRQWDAAGNVCRVDGVMGSALVMDSTPLNGHVYGWKNHALLGEVHLDLVARDFPASQAVQTTVDGRFSVTGMSGAIWSMHASKSVSDTEAAAITASDAWAALVIAAGRNPNADGKAVSPYQFMAADANGDGKVTSADALAILKMALHHADAPQMQWLFVDETQDFWNETKQAFNTCRTGVSWESNMWVDGSAHVDRNIVAVLLGDVDGSVSMPAASTSLDAINPAYFFDLAQKLQVPVAQWGL